jgi:hypothetical protein
MREILKNISTWRTFQDDKGYYFNGWILNLPEGQLIVDPPALSEEAVKMILKNKEDAKELCRQDEFWMKLKS